ncbi:hypothetical protein OFS07_10525 [Brachyspira hyodysenteriae]|nr:hypothetical protein [Brachyspira hyodysenteriae]MDA0066698.1 hypothetical protein [Brachyspira hyodysenteriae]MDA0071740.1 hypothetical protein [Brachyspira hyodysenteriae]MDA0089656.1 hypothetical protein [Brachyspira hyodysenteriae]
MNYFDFIRQKIKELDKENKIKDIKVYTKDDDIYIIFDDVFKVIVDKWNLIFAELMKIGITQLICIWIII